MAKLIGGLPNQVPTNGDLGTMAYQDYDVVAPQFLAGGRRNLIVNGAMQVAQRGTVATGGSTGTYYGGCDRWRMYQENTAAAYTLSKDTNSPNNFGSSLKVDITTADATVGATDRVDLIYRFEGNELQGIGKGTADAKQLTLSFWVSSPKTGVHTVDIYDWDNTRQIGNTYTVNSANTWEYKTITFPADTIGALDDDTNASLQFHWWLMAGSNYTGGTFNSSAWASNTNANRVSPSQVNVMDSTSNNFYLTGVQLEVGSVATPFEHRSYGEELALCQRYYQERTNWYTPTYIVSSSMVYARIADLSINMRATPTITTTNLQTNRNGTWSSQTMNGNYSSVNGVSIHAGGTYSFSDSVGMYDSRTKFDAEL